MGGAGAALDEHAGRRVRPRRRARRGGDDHPRAVPVDRPDVVLFHAQGCHLCERARAQLAELRAELDFDLREVDIGGDEELEARYRAFLPVVEIDGARAFVYHLQPEGFRRRLAAQSRSTWRTS